MKRGSRSGLGMLCAGIALCGWGAARADQWDGVAWGQRAPGGMRAWFVLPTKLVLDDASLPQSPAPQPFGLRAGRGEYECVQLVVRPDGDMKGVRVSFTPFAGGPGRIPATAWQANKVGTVPGKPAPRAALTLRSWPAGANGTGDVDRIPDPLLPDPVFDLQGGAYNRIWLTVRVPKDAAPGRYEGRVRLLRENATLLEAPLSLTVWNFTLPDETHLVVMGNVWANPEPFRHGKPLWDHLRPYYDNLKAHRINATASVYPFEGRWQRGEPAPETADYERALRYVLDDLKFVRFRMASGGGAAGGSWGGLPVFQKAAEPRSGVWINGSGWVREHAGGAKGARWNRVAGQGSAPEDFGGALLAAPRGTQGAWVEYAFQSKDEKPFWVWLQIEPIQKQEKKIVYLDGKRLGVLTSGDSWKDPLGFARLPEPVTLAPGRHTLRVEVADVAGASDPLYAVYLTPDERPDFERLLRERAALTPAFKEAFRYHFEQAAAFLKERGWLDKAQIKLKDEPGVGEYGRVAAVYEYARELLPGVERELSEEPYAILRQGANVWTPYASAARFDIEAAVRQRKAGDEVWLYHNFLHGIGYPSVGMRLIPWMLWRHDLNGYLFWAVNSWTGDPWTDTSQGGTFMRGAFLYPNPKDGTPVNSVRWELFREGLEDYETLRLLSAAVTAARKAPARDPGAGAALREAEGLLDAGVKGLVRTPTDFAWDPAALERVRTRVGESLSALTAPK